MLLLPAIGNAAIVSQRPDAVSVTIYRASEEGNPDLANPNVDAQGIALISEARELELPEGESVIEFVGVAQTIVPQSARLDSLPSVMSETNFDYKLISPGDLIANSIGQTVRLVRTDEHIGKITEQRGRLVSGPDGVVLDIDGKIEALDCSGAHEKLVFDSLPENLRSKPVLSAKVRVNKAGHHVVRLSYLAMNFDWSANYVAQIRSDSRTLDLTGWVTLANKQDTSFLNAPVQVIAGNVERDESTTAVSLVTMKQQTQCWPIGKLYGPLLQRVMPFVDLQKYLGVIHVEDEDFGLFPDRNLSEALNRIAGVTLTLQRDLGDYKLYQLPFKSDLLSRQVKQVMMTQHHQVPFDKIYTYTLRPDPDNLDDDSSALSSSILIRMQNKQERGLGKSLPAGNVVVMEPNDGREIVVGEDNIVDSPVGLPIDIEVGSTPEVAVMPRVVKSYKERSKEVTYKYFDLEVTLSNQQPRPVQFEFRQDTTRDGMQILQESVKHIMHKGLPTWAMKISPRSQKTIRYTVRYPY